MKNSLHIAIPQPCQEDWDKMTPTEQGRFCDVCSKCVVDFTQFSDADLLAYFSNAPKNVCGRFDNRQLNKTIEHIPVYSPWFSFPKKWMLAVGLWAGMLAKGFAQTPSMVQSTIAQQETSYLPTTTSDSTRILKGIVIDSTTNEPLIGVTVLIKGTKTGSATDLEGKFKLTLPKEYFNKEAIIEVRYAGYETVFYTLSANENNSVVYLKEAVQEIQGYIIERAVILGIVSPDPDEKEVCEAKPTRWQRFKAFFKNLF